MRRLPYNNGDATESAAVDRMAGKGARIAADYLPENYGT
jgi:hypothetical protein